MKYLKCDSVKLVYYIPRLLKSFDRKFNSKLDLLRVHKRSRNKQIILLCQIFSINWFIQFKTSSFPCEYPWMVPTV